jgi:hypothetical protein
VLAPPALALALWFVYWNPTAATLALPYIAAGLVAIAIAQKPRRLRMLYGLAMRSTLFGLVVALSVDYAKHLPNASELMVWPVVQALSVPGDFITWLFILGDGGSEATHRWCSFGVGTAYYTLLGMAVGSLFYLGTKQVATTRAD